MKQVGGYDLPTMPRHESAARVARLHESRVQQGSHPGLHSANGAGGVIGDWQMFHRCSSGLFKLIRESLGWCCALSDNGF